MNRTELITRFVEDRFLVEFGTEVTPQSNLFDEGVIDSFGYVQLVTFLKEEFAIDLSEEDVLMNVLVTLDAIDAFVARKLAGQGGAPCAG
ncbi:acyl carrier protein [Streptomyces sp. NBC_00237]|uniref:acyl carrier protein n=1 Tax=Streptomyces sp. NBC_00237 TaxID=2975687 RepID=UPI002256767E|nr:acyl carrier protein [Streptomyces sp. NBC_00237]MCX5202698.1 acyl carrier protein [Streptomyces sp. NBC_00237]